MSQLEAALSACWQSPKDAKDLGITLSFSIRRDGTMIGAPRITWKQMSGDAALQKEFSDTALAAIEKSLPLPLTERMGQAIAGQPFLMRFVGAR